MRIAIVNWSSRKAGGAETYLSAVIPELSRIGHEVAFLHEVDDPAEREYIPLPDNKAVWSVSDLGIDRALESLRKWRPDLIYVNSLQNPSFETQIVKVAPAVFFAHAYYGTCISGAKSFKNKTVMPCSRRFGWQCLLQYYPRRCGGLNPLTMLKEYQRQSKRLENLHSYKAVVTHSDHMQSEYLKHGLSPDCVYNIPFPIGHNNSALTKRPSSFEVVNKVGDTYLPQLRTPLVDDLVAGKRRRSVWRVLFLGRMEFLKGGHTFLTALPQVCMCLDRPLHVIFAGEGLDRQAWERQAAEIGAKNKGIKIEFVGWAQGCELDALFSQSDLLVMPSLWPEPFGSVGPEAGLYGVPVAAFGVGGIPDWLKEGVNGHLASGDPPTAQGLSEAIVKCLRDQDHHADLCSGAVNIARQFNIGRHLTALLEVFETVIRNE